MTFRKYRVVVEGIFETNMTIGEIKDLPEFLCGGMLEHRKMSVKRVKGEASD